MPKTNEELIELAKRYVAQAEKDAEMNPASDTIQIVVVEPQKKPYKATIENELEMMQRVVGGYIEILTIGRTETGGTVAITLNEEGKLQGLPLNRQIFGSGGSDFLVGTFFITAFNMQGDNISLTDKQCERYIKQFIPMGVHL